jgi:hypothetical protein
MLNFRAYSAVTEAVKRYGIRGLAALSDAPVPEEEPPVSDVSPPEGVTSVEPAPSLLEEDEALSAPATADEELLSPGAAEEELLLLDDDELGSESRVVVLVTLGVEDDELELEDLSLLSEPSAMSLAPVLSMRSDRVPAMYRAA